ncbi:hypothetical protein BDK92_7184 [Micromonospora pisi]|uniref:Uncharacterized protein n=1 Tax=Micromonospora pisi TaxID=589240 RepID=A0A495JUL0_9ACTN|nr:hypothetical protein [Micromonospora pisi]RKR92706.1 hypothetical protein BDK92_7184 [Micromonospora pisi]
MTTATTATTYSGANGTTFDHISVTALTERDVDRMERVESALCRWARVTPMHHTQEDEICGVINDALILLEEYGTGAVENAATPADATYAEAAAWATVRKVTAQALRFPLPIQPTEQISTEERTARSTAHIHRAGTALLAGKQPEALYWLDAAEAVDPARDYDGLYHLVVTPWAICR